jgi:predicted CXXCH cytochrome family protein
MMNRNGWLALLFILTCIAALVFALSEGAHEFRDNECILCHVDARNRPDVIKPLTSMTCESCHSEMRRLQSHPSEIYPSRPIPIDLPLTDGKMTCLTCHYVHPKKKMRLVENRYFLRRLSRGIYFCSICHEFDDKRHIVLTNVHRSSFEELDSTTRIDKISLTCIECHDSHISKSDALRAGVWRHSSSLNHPIGLSYSKVTLKRLREFRPEGVLHRKMKLFDGKIGCGTCHSIYSQEKNMLVMDNSGSRLCLECHIK